MNKQKVYQQWLKKKQAVEIPEDFAECVMTGIYHDSHRDDFSKWDQWVCTPLAQAGLAIGALLVFVIRFVMLFAAAVG